MNLESFIQLNYYFNSRPSVGYFDFIIHLLVFFCVLFILATYFKIVYGIYRRHLPHYVELADRVSSWLYTISVVGFIYLFFRYEGIIYLSSRILLVAIIIAFLVWGYYIFQYYQIKFKEAKGNFAKKKEKGRYKPQSRKRKK